ncbi:MAG TPA: DUF4123 domain-containing protein [Bryobacteraceae bacterium]|nr:DUF4123 domain-containing protein [Bryobacteraceae bacterium]
MIDEAAAQQVISRLWDRGATDQGSAWAVLDGARDDRVYAMVDSARYRRSCLYAGNLPWQLEMTAPYLVQLYPDDASTIHLVRTAWGNSWGIFLRADESAEQLRRHLRTFLRVTDYTGRRLVFRYYDPRVMRVYLPTCRPSELRFVFGPIRYYLMEDEDPRTVLRYEFRSDKLEQGSFTIPVKG